MADDPIVRAWLRISCRVPAPARRSPCCSDLRQFPRPAAPDLFHSCLHPGNCVSDGIEASVYPARSLATACRQKWCCRFCLVVLFVRCLSAIVGSSHIGTLMYLAALPLGCCRTEITSARVRASVDHTAAACRCRLNRISFTRAQPGRRIDRPGRSTDPHIPRAVYGRSALSQLPVQAMALLKDKRWW